MPGGAIITNQCNAYLAAHPFQIQLYAADQIPVLHMQLTNPDIGRIKINYRRIECTPPEDMKVSVMDFVGGGRWIRLAVDDTGGRGQVTQVSVRSSGSGAWIPMVNKWGAAWELGQAPSPPLDFKFETDDGEEVGSLSHRGNKPAPSGSPGPATSAFERCWGPPCMP